MKVIYAESPIVIFLGTYGISDMGKNAGTYMYVYDPHVGVYNPRSFRFVNVHVWDFLSVKMSHNIT